MILKSLSLIPDGVALHCRHMMIDLGVGTWAVVAALLSVNPGFIGF